MVKQIRFAGDWNCEAFKIVLGHNYYTNAPLFAALSFSASIRCNYAAITITVMFMFSIFSCLDRGKKAKKIRRKTWKIKTAKLTVSHVTYVLLRNSQKIQQHKKAKLKCFFRWPHFRFLLFGKVVVSAGLENELCGNRLIELLFQLTCVSHRLYLDTVMCESPLVCIMFAPLNLN